MLCAELLIEKRAANIDMVLPVPHFPDDFNIDEWTHLRYFFPQLDGRILNKGPEENKYRTFYQSEP